MKKTLLGQTRLYYMTRVHYALLSCPSGNPWHWADIGLMLGNRNSGSDRAACPIEWSTLHKHAGCGIGMF